MKKTPRMTSVPPIDIWKSYQEAILPIPVYPGKIYTKEEIKQLEASYKKLIGGLK